VAVAALADDLLPPIRVEMVDRPLHEGSLADLRRIGRSTSLVDRVTLTFAARYGIARVRVRRGSRRRGPRAGLDGILRAAGLSRRVGVELGRV
jgi:hypothetical protein